MRQHCAQCLTEVLAGGYDTPNGQILCGPCYFALWGPKVNGNRVSNVAERYRPRSRRPKKPRAVWLAGPTRELDFAGSSFRPGIWRRQG